MLFSSFFLGEKPSIQSLSQRKEFKGTAKEILGTCFAVGCTVDGQKPGALQQAFGRCRRWWE